jgi:hypothetical protein
MVIPQDTPTPTASNETKLGSGITASRPSADAAASPSSPPRDKSVYQSLLQKMSGTKRWCAPSKVYSLQIVGSTIVWKDNFGSVDFEQILSATPTEVQTKTQKSDHLDGKHETLGTIWTYRLAPGDKINVTSTNVKSPKTFTLAPC